LLGASPAAAIKAGCTSTWTVLLLLLLLQGFMNWNALRHVSGSSTEPGADRIRTIRDGPWSDWGTYVMLINAGCDYNFWQVGATGWLAHLEKP
jgi:hypothetical protein